MKETYKFFRIHLILGPQRSHKYAKYVKMRPMNTERDVPMRRLNTEKDLQKRPARKIRQKRLVNTERDLKKRPAREMCQRHLWTREATYKRDLPTRGVQKSRGLQKCAKRDVWIHIQYQWKRHTYCLSYISTTSRGTKETSEHGKRHRKETYVLSIVHQRHIKGYKRDL